MNATATLDETIHELAAELDRVLVSAFLGSVPDNVYFKDHRSRFMAVSASMLTYHNLKASEIIGRTDFDLFSPAHARKAFEDEARIMRTGQPLLDQLERESWSDGRVRWVLTSKMPLRDEHDRIVGTFGLSKDVTATREMEFKLEQAHKDLVEASRVAGMAEVATGVLHNVGNVLNSLNVAAAVIGQHLRDSKAESLLKLAALLREQADLGRFITEDPKGRRIPELVASLARHAVAERDALLGELNSLQKNVDHIKEIVSLQQAYATTAGLLEPLDPILLFEDALRMNADALNRHHIEIQRQLRFTPPVLGEKAKILQILVNLIRNAKHACDEGGAPQKRITLAVEPAEDDEHVRLIVADNGVGIPAENLTRIFRHGFTTRANGHGFGLHSAANAARQMHGTLTAASAGPGQGATFTLTLPAAVTAPTA